MLAIQLVTVSPCYCLTGKRQKCDLITIPAAGLSYSYTKLKYGQIFQLSP